MRISDWSSDVCSSDLLLWARVGIPYSPATGEPISAQTVSQMVDRVMELPEGTRAYLLAPAFAAGRVEYAKDPAHCRKKGSTRVRFNEESPEFKTAPASDGPEKPPPDLQPQWRTRKPFFCWKKKKKKNKPS